LKFEDLQHAKDVPRKSLPTEEKQNSTLHVETNNPVYYSILVMSLC